MKRWLKTLIPDTHPVRLAYHRMHGLLAALTAGFPARRLRVIAVTGTDGKTTTVAMIAHILHATGHSLGAVSTAFFEINGERRPNPTQKTSIPAGGPACARYRDDDARSRGLIGVFGFSEQLLGLVRIELQAGCPV